MKVMKTIIGTLPARTERQIGYNSFVLQRDGAAGSTFSYVDLLGYISKVWKVGSPLGEVRSLEGLRSLKHIGVPEAGLASCQLLR